MPWFGALTNPFTESPVNCTACATAGCASAIVVILRSTESVRSSDAASGSWAIATRYCLSCGGMNPSGTVRNISTVSDQQPA